jgi:hypothetical protein
VASVRGCFFFSFLFFPAGSGAAEEEEGLLLAPLLAGEGARLARRVRLRRVA